MTHSLFQAVKDRLDYIIAVVCGDVEKAPILENSKYELNVKTLRVSLVICVL